MHCTLKCQRAAVFYNRETRLSIDEVQRRTGCTHIIGGWLFNNHPESPDYLKPCNWLRINGKTEASDEYNDWCFTASHIDPPQMSTCKVMDFVLSGVPLLKDGKKLKRKLDPAVARPAERQAIGWLPDGRVLIWCDKAILTREQLQERMLALGAVDALMMDGGGSVQGRGPGWAVRSSRILSTLICLWEASGQPHNEKEEKPVKKYTVCLDPGHDGDNRVNKSPDGSYYEAEFALDMSKRIKAILEGAGVNVVETRKGTEKVSLNERCRISNGANADLFVSLHSNAAGGKGWSSARGWEIYAYGTSGKGPDMAHCICRHVDAMGVILRSNPVKAETYYVLRHTKAPAVLIEHGFHTNQADVSLMNQNSYRQMLAQAEAEGILEHLGLLKVEVHPEPPAPPKEPTEAEKAIQWVQEQGIMLGNEQGDLMLDQPVTRRQLAVMLYRAMHK